ncbi:MAG: hypothetical protein FWG66_01965, partial [Spirochaetes bacterium]|nr:hypothetical protein [Spirochaetota bacterium]
KEILCFEYERTVACDYTLRFENRLFQILDDKKALPRPRDKVTVRVALDGSISVLWKKEKLLVKEFINIQCRQPQKAS